MGVGLVLTSITVAATLASATFAIIASRRGQPDPLAPSLDDFNPTLVKQDVVIPLHYGRVRVRGNLIFFGNVISQPIKQKGGGKGGGGSSVVVGHKLFCDLQQTIGEGKYTLIDTIVDDKIQDLQFSNFIFNTGDGNVVPGFTDDQTGLPLEFDNAYEGICNVAIFRLFCGDNATTIPTIEFIIERDLSSLSAFGMTNPNLPNGSNPAAILMDGCLRSGYSISELNITSFTELDSYCQSRGYGLNLTLDRVKDLDDLVKEVAAHIDIVKFEDNLGRIGFRALSENDTHLAEIQKKEFKQFSISRATWDQTPNDFEATFLDENLLFKADARRRVNPAAQRLAGRRIVDNRNLKGFRDADTLVKRLTEIRNRDSYPGAEYKFTVSQKYSVYQPGDILRIANEDFGILQADVRITEITVGRIDSNDVSVKAVQFKEGLFDDKFSVGEGNLFPNSRQDFALQPANVEVFELPYIDSFSAKYLLLVERIGTFETGYLTQISTSSSGNFENILESTEFSLKGQLQFDYSGDGTRIDDEVGIDFSFSKFDPEFDTIDRDLLTVENRIAIIGDEILGFEKVTITGPTSARLEGVVRGVFNTPIQNHLQFDTIWLTTLSDNIIEPDFANFFIKVLPRFLDDIIEPGLVTTVNVETENKALQPRDVSVLWATKSGLDVDVKFFPSTPGVPGLGEKQVVEPYEGFPSTTTGAKFYVEGDFPTVELLSHQDITVNPGSFPTTITVKSELNGIVSTGLSVIVDNVDRKYRACL